MDNEAFWLQYNKVHELKQELIKAEWDFYPKCPECGTMMEIKMGYRGEFWSCLGYPEKCNGSMDYKRIEEQSEIQRIKREIRKIEEKLME
jgi:ssDNA-binding Zn-finger/Zn-ribbon topoisomerase 1